MTIDERARKINEQIASCDGWTTGEVVEIIATQLREACAETRAEGLKEGDEMACRGFFMDGFHAARDKATETLREEWEKDNLYTLLARIRAMTP